MDYPNISDTGIQLPIRPHAIAFDLDGTLLDYDGCLGDSVTRSVRLISQAGFKVFLITGRLHAGAEEYWTRLGLSTPIAACNGAYVGFPDQEPLLHIRLSEKARDAVMEMERRHGLYVNYYIDNRVYTMRGGAERDWYSRQFSPVEEIGTPENVAARRLPTKCLCITAENEQERIMKLLADAVGEEATVTRSNERFIEIVPTGADKAVGLKALADWGGIPLESVIAVGDAMNDLPMLRAAGFAISFKSGDPRLIEHVDMLLPPLWEDGMEILAKCVLGMTNSGRFMTERSTRFFRKD